MTPAGLEALMQASWPSLRTLTATYNREIGPAGEASPAAFQKRLASE